MKKYIFIVFLLINISFASSSQIIWFPDSTEIKTPPYRPNYITNNNIIGFTTIASSDYIISIEKEGEIISFDKTTLRTGETYIIDMSNYTIGYYNIEIIDVRNNLRYYYFYLKEDDNVFF